MHFRATEIWFPRNKVSTEGDGGESRVGNDNIGSQTVLLECIGHGGRARGWLAFYA